MVESPHHRNHLLLNACDETKAYSIRQGNSCRFLAASRAYGVAAHIPIAGAMLVLVLLFSSSSSSKQQQQAGSEQAAASRQQNFAASSSSKQWQSHLERQSPSAVIDARGTALLSAPAASARLGLVRARIDAG